MNLCRHHINEFFNSTGDNTNEKFAGYYGYDANGERAFFIFRFQDIEIWRLFCFFLLYLKKVKVFHDFSCVFEKNVVPLHHEKCIEYKNMHPGECKLN